MLTGLYQPSFEKDSCGFGLIAQMDGKASHWLVETSISSLTNLTHRGAVAADGKTGDGCGLLFKKPDSFLKSLADENAIKLSLHYAVGMVFLSTDEQEATTAKAQLEAALAQKELICAGWRTVPTDNTACGAEALKSLPNIMQVFVNAPDGMDEATFERNLYIARRLAEKAIDDPVFYIPSLSSRVISYKGLVMPNLLPVFYKDLNDPRFESALCVYHQRFSTNTWPQWRLAQPFRYLAHNGEINTIEANRNWALGRGSKFESPLIPDMEEILPLVGATGSDSSSLDNMLEALLAGGMDIFRAMRLLIPPAWQNVQSMDPKLHAFYEYNSMHMEPWDGPAGIVLTDGRYAGCVLDRNGLRPARYMITEDRHITLASEIGVYDYDDSTVVAKGRLKPGEMIAVDTETGRIIYPEDINNDLKLRQPYQKWLKQHARNLEDETLRRTEPVQSKLAGEELDTYQKLFQVSLEERDQVLRVLAESGQEATGSMGDDTPYPVLSQKVRSVYDYFRQQFAQVTNPPIDPLREKIVMSLRTCFGRECNLFNEVEANAARLEVISPVLSHSKIKRLISIDDPNYAHEVIDLNYDASIDLQSAITAVCDQAVQAVKNGKVILILSDKNISKETMTVHALLATGAVHHRLIAEGLRCDANIVVETGSARDPHHFATLIGYGATAVYPYLAYEIILDLVNTGSVAANNLAALESYRRGINKGLYKIISKMGISTITSYRGAQLFEAVGLHDDVVDLCFKGTTCRVQGSNFNDLELEQASLKKRAWSARKEVDAGGLLKFVHDGEYHAYNPDVVQALQVAVKTGNYDDYKKYADLVNQRDPMVLRDLLGFREDLESIDINEVEGIEDILPRFDSAGMSLGALSPEADRKSVV